jgi:hypothetical protein
LCGGAGTSKERWPSGLRRRYFCRIGTKASGLSARQKWEAPACRARPNPACRS